MTTSTEHLEAWRDRSLLVLRRKSPVAPERCIVTNEPVFGHGKISKQLSWGRNGPAGAWIPTKFQILWALADMKFVTVTVGLSDKVKAKRLGLLLLALGGATGGIVLFVAGILQGFPPHLLPLGMGAAMAAIALTLFANTYVIVEVVAMDDDFVWLRGARSPFLDSLPQFEGESLRNRPTVLTASAVH